MPDTRALQSGWRHSFLQPTTRRAWVAPTLKKIRALQETEQTTCPRIKSRVSSRVANSWHSHGKKRRADRSLGGLAATCSSEYIREYGTLPGRTGDAGVRQIMKPYVMNILGPI